MAETEPVNRTFVGHIVQAVVNFFVFILWWIARKIIQHYTKKIAVLLRSFQSFTKDSQELLDGKISKDVYTQRTAWLLVDTVATYVIPFWSWWRFVARRVIMRLSARI